MGYKQFNDSCIYTSIPLFLLILVSVWRIALFFISATADFSFYAIRKQPQQTAFWLQPSLSPIEQ